MVARLFELQRTRADRIRSYAFLFEKGTICEAIAIVGARRLLADQFGVEQRRRRWCLACIYRYLQARRAEADNSHSSTFLRTIPSLWSIAGSASALSGRATAYRIPGIASYRTRSRYPSVTTTRKKPVRLQARYSRTTHECCQTERFKDEAGQASTRQSPQPGALNRHGSRPQSLGVCFLHTAENESHDEAITIIAVFDGPAN